MADLADEPVISAEVGIAKPDVAKPDARIFEHALSRLDLAPHEVVFVDHTPAHVDIAAGLGMRGHVHRDAASTDAASTVAAIESFVDLLP